MSEIKKIGCDKCCTEIRWGSEGRAPDRKIWLLGGVLPWDRKILGLMALFVDFPGMAGLIEN